MSSEQNSKLKISVLVLLFEIRQHHRQRSFQTVIYQFKRNFGIFHLHIHYKRRHSDSIVHLYKPILYDYLGRCAVGFDTTIAFGALPTLVEYFISTQINNA